MTCPSDVIQSSDGEHRVLLRQRFSQKNAKKAADVKANLMRPDCLLGFIMHAETLCPGRIYIHEGTIQTWRFHGIEVDQSQRKSLIFSPFPPASAGSILYTSTSSQFVTRLVLWENNEAGLDRLEVVRQLFKTLGMGESDVLLSLAFSDILHTLPDQEAYALWSLQQRREILSVQKDLSY
jgi:hypothetical protein